MHSAILSAFIKLPFVFKTYVLSIFDYFQGEHSAILSTFIKLPFVVKTSVLSIFDYFQGEHSVILSTFIKLPFVFKTYVLPIFERPFKTGSTVHENADQMISAMGVNQKQRGLKNAGEINSR